MLAPEAEDRIMQQAPELIPGCVIEIADYWRRIWPRKISVSPKPGRHPAATKVGRNERCPCGSGKKFKKCCGQNG
jgi:uncharacterized protein